ncbi:MAG: hypothetical protein CM15mP127_02350 [Gammaproteobacteria bacterium]|nr:MAG: hypothetical protein CM15mP127_02350 [Gammaproteobacteria bacterium]
MISKEKAIKFYLLWIRCTWGIPDTTAAEAIRRLSGISVENDQGEGRYVSIRGLSSDLNSIAVNGALMPAPEGNRSVMLDGLPTELLDSIEVSKSLTPDQDADSIEENRF